MKVPLPVNCGLRVKFRISIRWMSDGVSSSSGAEADAVRKILMNGKHRCPGCGAPFHLKRNCGGGDTAGLVNWSQLASRIRFVKDAPSHEPALFVAPSHDKTVVMGNKFDRQGIWFGRQYTRVEEERIKKRLLIPPGKANEVLQSLLQGKTPSKLQFTNREVLEDTFEDIPSLSEHQQITQQEYPKLKLLTCQRCYHLEHPSDSSSHETVFDLDALYAEPSLSLHEKDRSMLREVLARRNSTLVMLCDVTDLPHSLPFNYLSLLPVNRSKLNVILVANKLDLMPKHLRPIKSYVEEMARSELRTLGWTSRVNLQSVHLVSSSDGDHLGLLAHDILSSARDRHGHVLMMGRTNVGKSRLFNALMQTKKLDTKPTVSSLPGTTMGVVKSSLSHMVKLAPNKLPTVPSALHLLDLPGFMDPQGSAWSGLLSAAEFRESAAKHRFSLDKRKLASGEVGLVAGLLRIHVVDCTTPIMVKTYLKTGMPYFHMTSMAEAQDFVETHLGKIRKDPPHLMPPKFLNESDPRIPVFMNPKLALTVTLCKSTSAEIALSDGLGWISFHLPTTKDRATIEIYTPTGLGVASRPCLEQFMARAYGERAPRVLRN